MQNTSVSGTPRDPMGKAMRVLRWMVESPGRSWGVRELAQAMEMAPSTAHRLLATLRENELVAYDEESRTYSIALEFLRLAHLASAKLPIPEVSIPHVRRLVEAVNETAIIGLYDSHRQMVMFHTVIESTHPLRYVVELGRWLPITVGASGFAILAFLPEEERRRLLSRSLEVFTDRTITNPVAIEHELETIRQRGYAISHGQRYRGAIGMVSPVFGPGTKVLGEIALTIPEQRFDPALEGPLARHLVAAAGAISRELGWTSTPAA